MPSLSQMRDDRPAGDFPQAPLERVAKPVPPAPKPGITPVPGRPGIAEGPDGKLRTNLPLPPMRLESENWWLDCPAALSHNYMVQASEAEKVFAAELLAIYKDIFQEVLPKEGPTSKELYSSTAISFGSRKSAVQLGHGDTFDLEALEDAEVTLPFGAIYYRNLTTNRCLCVTPDSEGWLPWFPQEDYLKPLQARFFRVPDGTVVPVSQHTIWDSKNLDRENQVVAWK